MPGLRTNGRGRNVGNQQTPGLRGRAAKAKNDRLGPAQGKVLSDAKVNGIHVRVSAPRARPDTQRPAVIDTKARERHISPDAPPELMASQSTQVIAGQETPRRSSQTQQPGTRRRPQVQQLPQEAAAAEPVIEVTAEEKPAMPAGTYWSDKHDSYIEPGDERYSQETAQRMGALG